ncbi:hypothetical protein [Undibacterium sp. Di24W]|uniref:hypothetical protein n=1 Tax=Undibacterium sp. Di24W TaxID=3413033 RepID=UPI003BF0A3FE
MKQNRRMLLIGLLSLCACKSGDEAASFANGAATLKVPSGFRVLKSNYPNGITIASRSSPYVEVSFVYQSFREQAKINPNVSRTFLNGYAGTIGAERLSIGGSSTGALVQAPTSIGTFQEPAFESFGAVAFPDALVTFKLVGRGNKGADAIIEFKASGLPSLLSGLSAVGA